MPNQFLSPEGDLENYFITEYWLIDQYVGDTLWAWGHNYAGQLGDNTTTTQKSTPVTTFAGGTNWKQVACGQGFAAAIKTDGTLWTWGNNSSGKLGHNTIINRSTPVTTFAGGTNWKQVACAFGAFAAAIKTDGTLWTWGNNANYGALGNNDIITRSTPVTTFAGGTNWKQVSCGAVHAAAIKTDGTLWTWGYNGEGALGTNDIITRSTPVTTFAGGTNWKQVSCGDWYTAAIKTDGTLWTWGRNGTAQLGTNNIITRSTPVTTFAGGNNWKQVSCGKGNYGGGSGSEGHIAAIKTDGTLWTWGRNNTNGQLGDNTMITRSTPVTTFAGGTNWKQVSCGQFYTAAIKTDGTLWTWGGNSYAQLGINIGGNANFRCTPVTTFAGGTNWKQVAGNERFTIAITSGTDPTFFIA